MAFTLGVGPANANGGSGTTVAATLNSTTAGRHLIVFIGWESGTQTLSSVTCSDESDPVILTSSTANGGGRTAIAYLANNVNGGNKTVTATFSGSVTGKAISVQEFYGGDTASFLDAQNTATGSAANPSLSLTTATDNALVVSAVTAPSGSPTAGANYTLIAGTSLWGIAWKCEYDLDAGAAGAKTVDFVNATATNWTMAAASFKQLITSPVFTPGVGAATLAGAAPSLSIVEGSPVRSPAAAALAVTGYAPGFIIPYTLTPAAGAAVLAGYAPSLVVTQPVAIPAASLTMAGLLPTIDTLFKFSYPSAGAMSMATYAPAAVVPIVGTIAANLPRITVVVRALNGNIGTISASLHVPVFSGVGGANTIQATLPVVTASATGLLGSLGAIAVRLPVVAAATTGSLTGYASIAARLPKVRSALTGLRGGVATIATTLRAPYSTITAYSGSLATIDATLPPVTAVLSGYTHLFATVAATLPVPYAQVSAVAAVVSFVKAVVMNTKTSAVSEYESYAFNSFATLNGIVLAAGADGIYRVDTGDLDQATQISASFRTAQMDFGVEQQKRMDGVYMGLRAAGDMAVTYSTDEDDDNAASVDMPVFHAPRLKTRRVTAPRGMRGRYWQITVSNTEGCDFDIDTLSLRAGVIPSRRL